MSFTAIDITRLPLPAIIDQPDFETIFAARKARLIELAREFGNSDYLAGLIRALELESEPLVQLLQEDSYREMLLRAAVHDAGKGNLLAYARGAMLDHPAAFYGVTRQVIREADPTASPPVAEILEDDHRLRHRVQLAPEGFTTAGSEGSYIFQSLSASPRIRDVSVASPEPRHVIITVLSREGDGIPAQDILDAVERETKARRPLTDLVRVQAPSILTYKVHAVLTLYHGPDAEVVRASAERALRAYADEHHRLGHDITLSGLYAALHQPGVQNVVITEPATDIVVDPDAAAFCHAHALSVTVGGRDV